MSVDWLRRHPDGGRLLLALGVLVALGLVARGGPGRAETDLFHAVNTLPEVARLVLVPVMQLGSLAGALAPVAAALLARRPRLAGAVGAAALAAWVLATLAKAVVDRGRPAALLTGVVLRGAPASGAGYPSGHTAVAFAVATAAAPHLPRRWRWAGYGLAAVVALARVYVGAHLPLDVLGGAALGVAAGVLLRVAVRIRLPSGASRP